MSVAQHHDRAHDRATLLVGGRRRRPPRPPRGEPPAPTRPRTARCGTRRRRSHRLRGPRNTDSRPRLVDPVACVPGRLAAVLDRPARTTFAVRTSARTTPSPRYPRKNVGTLAGSATSSPSSIAQLDPRQSPPHRRRRERARRSPCPSSALSRSGHSRRGWRGPSPLLPRLAAPPGSAPRRRPPSRKVGQRPQRGALGDHAVLGRRHAEHVDPLALDQLQTLVRIEARVVQQGASRRAATAR